MRASSAEYLRLNLRAHELLRDVPLYDVSVVDLPGGGAGRIVADIRALESAAAASRVANAIYGLRHFFGANVRLGPNADAAGGLTAVAAVRARPPRLRNRPRHSRWFVPSALPVPRRRGVS